LGSEFPALRRQVKHIDGFLPFRVDQRDFDVVSQARRAEPIS